MGSKKPTNQELEDMFAGIGDDDGSSAAAKEAAPPKPEAAAAPQAQDNEDDPLADLRTNLASRQAASRSSTPHLTTISSSAASVRKNTPPSSRSGRSSEDKASTDAKTAASDPLQDAPAAVAAAAGSWWGGISSFASAAVKQARGAVEEIQKNEDALKWAEQVRGNYGSLRGLGDDLRSRALPTFTSLLHTLAPPISQHERLQIHIAHDIVGYPSLDPLVYQTFSRVMAQVEGGELLVIQRGSESMQRRPSEAAYSGSGQSGWTDGPWWRAVEEKRSMGAVPGLVEGSKLARATAEGYAGDFYAARGGVEEAAKQATASMSETNPTRSSDVFLAIQPITYTTENGLFAGSPSADKSSEKDKETPDELICFAIYLHDPVHSITFSALSQSIPQKWIDWMNASSSASVHDGSRFVPQLPEEIAELIDNGGVDPREWVSEWMEESLSLTIGIVAQRYVARRMGVGEGGIGRAKRREEIVESGGGEAARAM